MAVSYAEGQIEGFVVFLSEHQPPPAQTQIPRSSTESFVRIVVTLDQGIVGKCQFHAEFLPPIDPFLTQIVVKIGEQAPSSRID